MKILKQKLKRINSLEYQMGFILSVIFKNMINFLKNKTTKIFKDKKEGSLKFQTGFTLVEMITAVAIFALVMVVAMGSLLNVLSANRQSQAIQTAVNNLNLAMETMSREIRTGYNYHCGSCFGSDCTTDNDCPAGDSSIAFEPYNGNPSSYSDQVIFMFDQDNQQILKSTNNGDDYLGLTSPELHVEDLTFIVVGSDPSDTRHPKVLITASGYVQSDSNTQTSFNLQTTVSQRLIDFDLW
ncbi:MAG: type II secretion system protein [Patescibacteria group bacterium]